MIPLLFAAMLQVPQDTVVLTVPMPPQVRDTTVVNVHVPPIPDSILTGVSRAQEALNEAILACGCTSAGGPPDWFYAGVLTLGSLFLYRYWSGGDDDDDHTHDIDVDVTVEPPEPPPPPPYDPCPNRE